MSLSAAISKVVDSGFNAIGDLKTSIVITNQTEGTYDPVTDTYSDAETESSTISCVVTKFTISEIAASTGTIRVTDVKVILNATDVTVPITLNTTFTIEAEVYRIVAGGSGSNLTGLSVNDVIYTLQLRAL